MLSGRIVLKRGSRDDGEKPFWISFADLMTALMVLFMVAMVISLLSVTQQLRDVQADQKERKDAIERILNVLKKAAREHNEVRVDRDRMTIDFGDKARFASGSHQLASDGEDKLREFVPVILAAAETDDGAKWFKRVVVEGFTDTDGSYLMNLNLSLKRAEAVVCTLLERPEPPRPSLTDEQMKRVRELFLVGGFSFNSSRGSKEESRRVELRLDFFALGEKRGQVPEVVGEVGQCKVG